MTKKLRVLLFGAGLVGRRALPAYREKLDVIAFADNDPKKQGDHIMGTKIIAPSTIQELDFDFVLITSTSAGQILDQLLDMGITKEIIKIADEVDDVFSPRFPWDAVLFLMMMLAAVSSLAVFNLDWM